MNKDLEQEAASSFRPALEDRTAEKLMLAVAVTALRAISTEVEFLDTAEGRKPFSTLAANKAKQALARIEEMK